MLESLTPQDFRRYQSLLKRLDNSENSRRWRGLPKGWQYSPNGQGKAALEAMEPQRRELLEGLILGLIKPKDRARTAKELTHAIHAAGHSVKSAEIVGICEALGKAKKLARYGSANYRKYSFPKVDQQQWLIGKILEIGLIPGDIPRSCRDIGDRLRAAGLKFRPQDIQKILKALAAEESPRVIRWGKVQHAKYRLPLPLELNLVVLENHLKPSERLGWIERWAEHRQKTGLFPVVRWLDGSTSFSQDELLYPAKDPKHFQWAKQMREGNRPQPPCPIPSRLLKDADPRKNTLGLCPMSAVTAIAIHLGWVEDATKTLAYMPRVRADVLDYLTQFYPGWQFGVNADIAQARRAPLNRGS